LNGEHPEKELSPGCDRCKIMKEFKHGTRRLKLLLFYVLSPPSIDAVS
jgi:hypothetical protein